MLLQSVGFKTIKCNQTYFSTFDATNICLPLLQIINVAVVK